MEINRNNYEQYFIDYLDGNLDPGQEKVLRSFLEFNPDLKEELEGLEKAYLVPAEQSYGDKDVLLKAADPFEERCIDFMEGQMKQEEEIAFRQLISEDSQREITLKLYQSTILIPDNNIVYAGKSNLLKPGYRRTAIRMLIPAAAAAAALLFGILLIFGPDGSVPGEQNIPITDAAEQSNPGQQSLLAKSENTTPAVAEVPGEETVETAAENTSADMLAFRETIDISRIQPRGISRVMAVSAIPSYALIHKLNDGPGRLEQLALQQVDEGLKATMALPERAKSALWRIADAGVRGLNQITEEDVELARNVDDDGRTRSLRFETEIFGISTPLQNLPAPQ
jgi:hypothetical protein